MKKSLVSKFLLGVMSLSMVFSVVGNNTAKAGGSATMTEFVRIQADRLFENPDISSEKAAEVIRCAVYWTFDCDKNAISTVLKRCFECFPNLINIGVEEYGIFENALYWFVVCDNVEMVNWLLDHGAIWIEQNEHGEYVNDGAAMFRVATRKAKETGKDEMLKCLLAHGYSADCVCKPIDPAQTNPPKVVKLNPRLSARIGIVPGRFGSK